MESKKSKRNYGGFGGFDDNDDDDIDFEDDDPQVIYSKDFVNKCKFTIGFSVICISLYVVF